MIFKSVLEHKIVYDSIIVKNLILCTRKKQMTGDEGMWRLQSRLKQSITGGFDQQDPWHRKSVNNMTDEQIRLWNTVFKAVPWLVCGANCFRDSLMGVVCGGEKNPFSPSPAVTNQTTTLTC